MKKLLVICAVASIVGCAPWNEGVGYVPVDDDVKGHSGTMEYTQKRRSVVESVERMLTDPMFTQNYDQARRRALDAGRSLPTIAINPLQNNTGDGRSDSEATGQLYRELQTALRKTGKFVLIDRIRRKQMTDAAIAGVNNGEESGAIQHVGAYASADFTITGDLRREATDDGGRMVFHHFLNLEMVDSASGALFWSDTVTVAKFHKK